MISAFVDQYYAYSFKWSFLTQTKVSHNYYMHRLTYSHSWGMPHECIWIHVNIFVFFFFYEIKINKNCFFFLRASEQRATSEEACPCCLHPRLPLHPVLSQKIRVSTENPNFYHNPNFNRIFPFWPASSSPSHALR